MAGRVKARVVAMGYSQVEGVDYFEASAPATSATSNRVVAAMACKLNWGLSHLDVDQAFIQSELDTDIYLRPPPGCGLVSGKQGSATQQGTLRSEAMWSSMVSALVVNNRGVWSRAMLGRSLCASTGGCW